MFRLIRFNAVFTSLASGQTVFNITLVGFCLIGFSRFIKNDDKPPVNQAAALAALESNRASSTGETESRKYQTSDVLYVYYLENTPEQLKKLVSAARGNEKIVLQFHREAGGVLGLTAWPGKKRNVKFSLGDEVYLKRGGASGVTLENQDVHLGNLELGPVAVSRLRTIAASTSPQDRYLVFVPKILRVADERINHIVYTVGNSPSPDNLSFMSSPMQLRITANPSPPKMIDFD